ncbi:MAG: methyltransferase domain-containing protein [Limnochordia bacterium]|jgi:23S rRNA (guanine745-N1)-methyltransferase|nr:methyltransferase domain-containing protein [Limnochordia bacterium]
MIEGVSKKEQALARFTSNIGVFCCPICGDGLRVQEQGVTCSRKHRFDLARKGYLNLFMGAQASQYNTELFLARQKVFAAGVYDPLVSTIAGLICDLEFELPFILDAGCGEGSFLARVANELRSAHLIGIDISRDGVNLATSHQAGIMWLVADLARLPLGPEKMDIVLSILSPANYGEFHRVLKPGGTVIKVLPGQDYLRELRERLPGVTEYSNEDVLSKFADKMDVQKSSRLHYSITMRDDLWQAMVRMTPLSQHRQISGQVPQRLTIDLQIVQGS